MNFFSVRPLYAKSAEDLTTQPFSPARRWRRLDSKPSTINRPLAWQRSSVNVKPWNLKHAYYYDLACGPAERQLYRDGTEPGAAGAGLLHGELQLLPPGLRQSGLHLRRGQRGGVPAGVRPVQRLCTLYVLLCRKVGGHLLPALKLQSEVYAVSGLVYQRAGLLSLQRVQPGVNSFIQNPFHTQSNIETTLLSLIHTDNIDSYAHKIRQLFCRVSMIYCHNSRKICVAKRPCLLTKHLNSLYSVCYWMVELCASLSSVRPISEHCEKSTQENSYWRNQKEVQKWTEAPVPDLFKNVLMIHSQIIYIHVFVLCCSKWKYIFYNVRC